MNYFEIKKLFEKKFADAKIEETSDIDWIIVEVTGKNRSMLPFYGEYSEIELKKILDALEKRLKHIPLGYIFGKSSFYGREFIVSRDTLIPRMDTEILIDEVIKYINGIKQEKNSISVLDIGTGSGAIAITIERETGVNVTAVDVSERAITVARENAKNLGSNVRFILSDLFSEISDLKFDIIVSNPPYIKSDVCLNLEPEVILNEPLLALDGGKDGLNFYRRIISESKNYLNINGKLFFEIGYDQAKDVENLMSLYFDNIVTIKDYCGNDRVVFGDLRS